MKISQEGKYIWSTLFHSLERNGIQCEGASALADALRVNKSLKTFM